METKRNNLNEYLAHALPLEVLSEYEKSKREASLTTFGQVEEIRLRLFRKSEIISCGESKSFGYIPDESTMSNIVYKLCQGSVYVHADTILQGYIRAPSGCRVGVCGRAVMVNGKMSGVMDISSIVIRLPCLIVPNFPNITKIFLNSLSGMLIISPPGSGKTTVLKSIAKELSSNAGFRVAIVDTKGELSAEKSNIFSKADILDGYPRAKGIELALRTLNPQVIICDEIGNAEDAQAILDSQNCGVPIIASAHGDSIEKTLKRPSIMTLHKSRTFEHYILLSREKGAHICSFKSIDYDEVSCDI